jgi:hypothetical protein
MISIPRARCCADQVKNTWLRWRSVSSIRADCAPRGPVYKG